MITITRTHYKKLHDSGQKIQFFTSDDVAMLGNGLSVSHYPQFYYQHLEKYQLLPRPYLGSFEFYIGEKNDTRKMGVRLVS